MKRIFFTILLLLIRVGLAEPLRAQTSPTTESELTIDDIAEACISGEAETLPLPFSDLDVNHWAFEATMNLYYGCFAHKFSAQQQSLDPSVQSTNLPQPDGGSAQVESSEL